MKLRRNTFRVLDVFYRCYPCKITVFRQAVYDEPIDNYSDEELDAKSPKCPRCKKTTKLYWSAYWPEHQTKVSPL